MSATASCTFQPIGHVRTDVADADVPRRRRDIVSTIEVLPRFAEALLGIEAYSHLFVLFWMDRAAPSAALTCHPRGNPEIPLTGVLAARGRNHPNPIGLAVVELLEVHGNRLRVRCLDAYDGTPVIDLKPYDDYDRVETPRVPAWFSARARRPVDG
ncbi:MAG: tRNA (N6-threonylcarbamoyladenosine(37)-N6)-methyltransferase TrmO [Gammaproteobacteria bacterium]